jgi:alpha-D-xyloside xylohydrolase
MKVLSHAADDRGLTLRTDHGMVSITPVTARSVRIRYTLEPEFSRKRSLTVRPEALAGPPVEFAVYDGADRLRMSTDALVVEIDCDTVALSYRTPDGRLLTREPARGGKTLDPVDVLVSVFDEAETVESQARVDGMRMEASHVRQVVDRRAYHTKLEFDWADDEALYGLGSHEEGMFNLRGQHQYLYQQNMKVAVPVVVSTRGYGVFLDCTSLVTFHDDAFGSYLWGDVDEELDYYVMVGPEFDGIVEEFRALTGTPPMLPRWALGYLQSKERYESQAELLAVAREYRDRGLPLDALILDWKSWTGDRWGQKSLDPDRFPDPPGMVDQLHALGVHLMVSIWPIMRPGGDDWRELFDAGHLLGNRATYDAFSEPARTAYWGQAQRGLFAHGVDGWWTDATEPFEADWTGPVKPEPEERLRRNTEEAKRYLDPELINGYSLMHAMGIHAGQRATGVDKRVVNLTRSAYPGQQRYGTVTWSGDHVATWATLRRQIAEGLSFCATGMPFWTTDIGAFFVARKPALWFWSGDYDDGVADFGYRELYLRWFQYAAWLPMFRSHGTDTPRELWRFGEPGEAIYDGLVDALRLRYRLLPYLYSMAAWTTNRAYTMLRALPFDFREDACTYDAADQFMFGPAFLVAPVLAPIRFGPRSQVLEAPEATRSVYLPGGTDWYDLWTDRRLHGGQHLEAPVVLEHIPVFVRAGSIVPMGPVRIHAQDQLDAPLEIHVYRGRDASFTLYEDEGDGYGYEQGDSATTELSWEDATGRLSIGARVGAYPTMPTEREIAVVVHDGASGSAVASAVSSARRLCYVGEPVTVDW